MDVVAEGHYSRKQLGSKSNVIAWSHASRFRKAVKIVGAGPTLRLLDYGCGDGTFIGLVADRFGECWGSDIAPVQVDDCRKRFAGVPGVHFCPIPELAGEEHRRAYDVVTCMETLEHCTAPIAETVLGDLARLCAPAGKVVISVPVEIGPTFVFKYALRKVAARRGLSDYRSYENYPLGSAVRMLFAGAGTVVDRPVYGEPGHQYHSHYGFNWRALRRRVGRSFRIEQTLFSPLGFLGGLVSSQVWLVCRPRDAGAGAGA